MNIVQLSTRLTNVRRPITINKRMESSQSLIGWMCTELVHLLQNDRPAKFNATYCESTAHLFTGYNILRFCI